MTNYCQDCGNPLGIMPHVDCFLLPAPPPPDAALAVLAELVGLQDEGDLCGPILVRPEGHHRRFDAVWARARALVAGQGEETP